MSSSRKTGKTPVRHVIFSGRHQASKHKEGALQLRCLQLFCQTQAVTDAWALGQTMAALDEYTVLRVR